MDNFKRLLSKEKIYIVGVSGGCDSMALRIRFLCLLKK